MVAFLSVERRPSITIKDIPEDLLERLRQRAAEDRRSMNKEVLHLIERALSADEADHVADATAKRIEVQVRTWRQLAGRWESNMGTGEEIDRIYAARTQGRQVDL